MREYVDGYGVMDTMLVLWTLEEIGALEGAAIGIERACEERETPETWQGNPKRVVRNLCHALSNLFGAVGRHGKNACCYCGRLPFVEWSEGEFVDLIDFAESTYLRVSLCQLCAFRSVVLYGSGLLEDEGCTDFS